MLCNNFRTKIQLVLIDFNVINESIIRSEYYKYGIWENANYPYNYARWHQQFLFTFWGKYFQAIDHLKGVSNKRPDIDSVFDFTNSSTAYNITIELLEEIITHLVNKNWSWLFWSFLQLFSLMPSPARNIKMHLTLTSISHILKVISKVMWTALVKLYGRYFTIKENYWNIHTHTPLVTSF